MKKTNLLVLAIAVALIAVVAAIAVLAPQSRTISENAPSVAETQTPAGGENAPDTEAQTAETYLVVTVGGSLYEPLPLTGEGSFVIRQDENTTNTVYVSPDSIRMEHSTCENQDCVDQGTVSLENMDERVLANMIICLPNEVVLELHTAQTLAETFDRTE